ncbi:MAG TPA: LysR family transcriptional regulator [Ktedonobacterales bacterium]|jgi:DNA-binding transcriptional LysR family regulator|nr:LysR family transcriptional regulator [Ktedonobacterales bacterium]
MVEWQQLEYFQVVAQTEHFTRAAERLSLSQPALSRAMARLEAELGAPLFERQGRRVRLTRYGRAFLVHVERALQAVEAGKREIADMAGPERGVVALAFLKTLGNRMLPDALRAFRDEHPQVRFQLTQSHASALLDLLTSGEVDLCLFSPPEDRPGMRWAPLLTEDLYVVAAANHPLASRESVALAELADEPLILLKPGYGMRRITDALCREAGFTPRIAFEGEDAATVTGLASAGLGVGFIPALAASERSDVRYLRVSAPRAERIIALAWMEARYLSAAATLFRDFTLAYFTRLSQQAER